MKIRQTRGVLAKVHLTVGPVGSPNPSCGYFLSSGIHNWDRHTQQLAESSPRFSDQQREYKWKPLELPLRREIVHQKQYCIPGIAEISATIKYLKIAGVVIPTTFLFTSPIWPVQKTDGSWRMTVDYHKLNQVVTPIATEPEVASLLDHINTQSGNWYAAINMENVIFVNLPPEAV